ncbi:MAG: mechanosensitive ion channel protein MscS [Bacteroidetes bacterium]|nr:MAG: mechanosensitive ion channel protein MscS [Bacteroidota bacterium]
MIQEKVVQKIKEVVTKDIWGAILDFLNLGIHFGEGENKVSISIGLVLVMVVSLAAASFLLKLTRKFYTRKMEEEDKLKFISVFKFIKYISYAIVFFVILSMTGINITPFLAASAALLVGFGLALQDLFQDIIGGIFIILDKSLLVGDIIEVEGKVGQIIEIKLRTTRAVTRDDKIIIIPNHKLIRNSIYNYTQNKKTIREKVIVGVAYGSDINKVKELLLQSVDIQVKVLKTPKPSVMFNDFGDSALIFEVYFFVKDSFRVPKIKSDIRFKIDSLFSENNITIPFPQRDVHLFNK